MEQEKDYRSISFWHETVDYERRPALEGEVRCDAAIVGGGFTGLWAAYFLKRARPDWKVVLLEQDVVGFGASGRNGGFAMTLVGWDISHLVRWRGVKEASMAYRAMRDGVEFLARVVLEEGIDCDLEYTGLLTLATNERRMRQLEQHQRHFETVGASDVELLDKAALAGEINSAAHVGGLVEPSCAILNPARLARGLGRLIERMGVAVYERTPVRAVEKGEPVRLRAARGTVVADRAILAVNAWSFRLGLMAYRYTPMFTYVVLTEPLPDAVYRELGWARRRGIETKRRMIHYLRLTADNRLLFGGETAFYFFGNAIEGHDTHPPAARVLESRMRRFFPMLSRVKVTHHWGGPIAVTMDFFPTAGVLGRARNISYGLAYCGHGVGPSVTMGRVLRDLALGEQTEYTDLFFVHRKPYLMPGEPLRWLGARAELGLYTMWDRHLDGE
jgi:glycine/D-amino acid oxidase-like deaminating enzyme